MEHYDLKRPSRGHHYAYFNANPQKLKTGDCVIRALAVAFDRTWYAMYDELCKRARDMATIPNDKKCWNAYLTEASCQPIQVIRKGKHLWKDGHDFAVKHKKGRYVLQMANHLSVAVDGVIYDIWDCSDRMVYKAWLVEGTEQ